jgi:hypothetical protein
LIYPVSALIGLRLHTLCFDKRNLRKPAASP